MAANDAKERMFQDVATANQRRIGAIARSYARADDWQDLYREILLQIWRGIDSFEERSAPSTWVFFRHSFFNSSTPVLCRPAGLAFLYLHRDFQGNRRAHRKRLRAHHGPGMSPLFCTQ